MAIGPKGTARMRTGLILAAIVFASGVTAAVAADAMQAGPSPRAVPPVPPTATSRVLPGGRVQVRAPIDGLDVRILESFPPRYMLNVLAGLPSGCAQKDRHEVSRIGEVITVTVLNSMPTGNPVCTMIYGTYELNIDLGTDFKRGVTYTVRVNDRTTTFAGQ